MCHLETCETLGLCVTLETLEYTFKSPTLTPITLIGKVYLKIMLVLSISALNINFLWEELK